MRSAQIYVKKYNDILTDLAKVICEAALANDTYALMFLSKSIHALMEKAAQIMDEERQRGGHC